MIELPDGFISGLPNCGVTAIAAATGASYPDVWEWFRTINGIRRGNWRAGPITRTILRPCTISGRQDRARLITEWAQR